MSVRSRALRVLAPAATSLAATPAFAQNRTVGDMISAAMTDMVGPLLFVVSILCTLGGVFLYGKGLLRLKDAHQGQGEMKQAFTNIVVATILVALPEAAGIGMMSIMGTSNIFFSTSELQLAADALDGGAAAAKSQGLSGTLRGLASVASPENCIAAAGAAGGGGGVPCMAKNIALNVVPIGIIAVFAFVYVAGLWGFGSALFELARHSGERGGGAPPGFWTKAVTAVLMLAAPPFFMAVSQSVTGSSGPVGMSGLQSSSTLLTYEIGGSGVLAQYSSMIGYLFHILALFGVVAFARGLFILKDAGERSQNATYSHGIVFMVAGILLANAKLSTCTILSTISGFGAASTVGFCSL